MNNEDDHTVKVELVYDDAIWLRVTLIHINAFITGDPNKFKTWSKGIQALKLLTEKRARISKVIDALTHAH